MSEENVNTDAEAESADAPAPRGLRVLVARASQAAIVHWRRTLAAAVTLALLLAGIAAMWTYTADLAIDAERAKLDTALQALDAGEYEQARALVREVLSSGALPRSEYGGPLFVLGTVKAHDASIDTMTDRRRTDYLVASRYLRESQAYGFAPDREKQGLLILGNSLIESYQTKQGIEVLRSALLVPPTKGGPLNAAIHRKLAQGYTLLRDPDFERALAETDTVLADTEITDDQREDTLVLKAKILGKLNRFDEAEKAFASLPAEALGLPNVLLARGQVLLDGVDAKRTELPPTADGSLPPELKAEADEAVALLSEANALEDTSFDVARRALYLTARAAELRGEEDEALRLYGETHEQYADTAEGVAALLAEADIARRRGDSEVAIIDYRLVLQGDIDPATYRNDVLPIDKLRQRILAAVDDYVQHQQFNNAMALLDRFLPLFTRSQELALRSQTLRDWGDRQLHESTGDTKEDQAARRAGLRRLREAGMAYERLAALRFATSLYPDDLWESANCFFRGQSYSNAARILDLYLQLEPEKRNAQALLMLGQAYLAMGRLDDCIASLEECTDLYELDNATYQARIDCARAYLYQGNPEKAEQLLRYNLTQSSLRPQSPEWKDSLFALGRLMFDLDRYEEAISTLEEAVERYPTDRQTLQARYLIGESYRRWAADPLERLLNARTQSEKEKNQQLVNERLTLALTNFKDVQSRITLQVHNVQNDPMYNAMRRNCYMLEGAVLFDLQRYQQAIEAYQNVSSLFPNEPFVLETFVQIANCWQRMNRPENAHGAIEQARLTLEQMPSDADFLATTAFNREEWRLLLDDMSRW